MKSFLTPIFTFVLSFYCINPALAQNAALDSLLNRFETTDSLKKKCTLATDIAWEYLYLEPDKTKEFALKALEIAKKAHFEYGQSSAWGSLGLYYDVTGDYDGAIDAYLQAIRILETLPEHAYSLSANYHNLSLIFMNIEDWEKAIIYAKKALQYDIDHQQYQGQVFVYMNIATMFGSANMLDSSLHYHYKAIEVGKKHKVVEYKVDYVNLADIEIQRENYDSAESYLKEYMAFAQSNVSSRRLNRLAHGYLSLSQLCLKRKEQIPAKVYIDSSDILVRQLKSPKLTVNVLENYAEYYALLKDYKSALNYFQEKEVLQDSITRMDLREKIEVVEAKYQKEKQIHEISQLRAENEIQELKLARTETQNSIYLIGTSLALLLLGLISYLFIQSRKKSKRLKAQNETIQNLIRESHHRIKNNLQVVSSLLNMQAKTVNSKEAEKAIADAHHRVKTIALLHQRLQGSSDFETIQLNDFLQNLSESIVKGMSSASTQVESTFTLQPIKVPTDKAIAIGLLINELITNSLKYAIRLGKPLKLLLQLENRNELKLFYTDNGPGLPPNFEIKDSSSLGFTIIHSLIDQLNGLLNISNQNGFQAEITIPYE